MEDFGAIFVTCRDDGDGEFMNILGNQLSEKGVLTFVTVGGKRGPGCFCWQEKWKQSKNSVQSEFLLHALRKRRRCVC